MFCVSPLDIIARYLRETYAQSNPRCCSAGGTRQGAVSEDWTGLATL